MNKFESKEAAFAAVGFNPEKVVVQGVPEQHIEAVKAFVNLCVAHDAVNPEFNPDYSNYDQYKYEADHEMGDPSGGGFRFGVAFFWDSFSLVGSRLVSESRSAANHIAEICDDDYRAMKVYSRKTE